MSNVSSVLILPFRFCQFYLIESLLFNIILPDWIFWDQFTFMHLADAFIQSPLQCIQVIHFLSICMCVPWELNPQRAKGFLHYTYTFYRWKCELHKKKKKVQEIFIYLTDCCKYNDIIILFTPLCTAGVIPNPKCYSLKTTCIQFNVLNLSRDRLFNFQ